MSIHERLKRLQDLASPRLGQEEASRSLMLKELRQLQLAIETPIETASRINFQILQNLCLRTAIERGVLQALAKHNDPRSASQLASETGTNELLLVRIMRVLTVIGFAIEHESNAYRPNALTQHAVSSGAIGALKHHFDLDMAMAGRLVSYLRRSPDNTFYQFAGEPAEATTLFEYTHGFPTIFGLLASDSALGREQKEAFEEYMAAKRPSGAGGMKQWFDIYPAAEAFKDARKGEGETLIVDVGGGSGQEIVGLKKRFPHLPGRYVLEDLPATLETAKGLPEGVEKIPHDFFQEQPVKGARAYFLRDVMHNWSDAKCTQILRRLVDAMDREYSVVLIDQYVLADIDAELRAAEMDILMLLHTSGIQRTVPMWNKLLGDTGLKIVKIWSAEGAHESVIEARIR